MTHLTDLFHRAHSKQEPPRFVPQGKIQEDKYSIAIVHSHMFLAYPIKDILIFIVSQLNAAFVHMYETLIQYPKAALTMKRK